MLLHALARGGGVALLDRFHHRAVFRQRLLDAAADQRANNVCNSVRPAPPATENDMNMA